MDFTNYTKYYPDKTGDTVNTAELICPELMEAFKEIDQAYMTIAHSASFINELRRIRREFSGRPTPYIIVKGFPINWEDTRYT